MRKTLESKILPQFKEIADIITMIARAEVSLCVPTYFALQLLHKSRRARFSSQTAAAYKRAHGFDTPHMIINFSNLVLNVLTQKADRMPQLLSLESKGST